MVSTIDSEVKLNGRLHPLRSSNDIAAVHQASLDLLQNGILVKSQAARDIFHGHGCHVEKRDGLVKIPNHVVESAIRSVPSQFLLAGRTQANDILIQNGHTYYTATSGSIGYFDPHSRGKRPPTQKDLTDCVRLMDATPEMDLVNRVLVPGDVNVDTVALHQLNAVPCHSSKPGICSSGNETLIHAAIEMAAAVAGSRKVLKKTVYSGILDMKSGLMPYGSPSLAVMNMAASQVEAWQEQGSQDMIERASAKALQIMTTHRPLPLAPKIEAEMKQIIESTEKMIHRDR